MMKPHFQRFTYVREEHQLEFVRPPVKSPFSDKSSSSKSGKSTISENFSCNLVFRRRTDVIEERLSKEEGAIEDIFTLYKAKTFNLVKLSESLSKLYGLSFSSPSRGKKCQVKSNLKDMIIPKGWIHPNESSKY